VSSPESAPAPTATGRPGPAPGAASAATRDRLTAPRWLTDLRPNITFNNLKETFTVYATLDSLGTPSPAGRSPSPPAGRGI
jgi:hypothetical protein